jgi:hypothetical protein
MKYTVVVMPCDDDYKIEYSEENIMNAVTVAIENL